MTRPPKLGFLYEFCLLEETDTNEAITDIRAEKVADQWLQKNRALLSSLNRDRTEPLNEKESQVYYKIYGTYVH